MKTHWQLHTDERVDVSVRPLMTGRVFPLVTSLIGFNTWFFLIHHVVAGSTGSAVLWIVLVLPGLVVELVTWYRGLTTLIRVTNQRIVVTRGWRSTVWYEIDYRDLGSVDVRRRVRDRLKRYRDIQLETSDGLFALGPIRHADALRRVIDRARRPAPLAPVVVRDRPWSDPWSFDAPR